MIFGIFSLLAVVFIFVFKIAGINGKSENDSQVESSTTLRQPSRGLKPVNIVKSSELIEPGKIATKKQRELEDLLPNQFVVVDLETTGLSPANCEIIEIGAVKVTLGEKNHATFQTFVKPSKPIPKKIIGITGITEEMIEADSLELHDALTEFKEFIGALPLVAYNAPFDMGFLWTAATNCNMTLTNRYTCALKRARRAWPELPSHKLSKIAEILDLPDNDQHRAIGDCIRTVHVFTLAVSTVNSRVRWDQPTKVQ